MRALLRGLRLQLDSALSAWDGLRDVESFQELAPPTGRVFSVGGGVLFSVGGLRRRLGFLRFPFALLLFESLDSQEQGLERGLFCPEGDWLARRGGLRLGRLLRFGLKRGRRSSLALCLPSPLVVFVLLELDEGSVFREAAAAFGDFDLDLPRVLPSLLVLGVTLESRRAAETKKSHAVARRRMCQKARQGKMRRGHKK